MSDSVEKVQLTIQIPAELRQRAKVAAAKQGESLSAVIRDALEDYIERVEETEASPELIAAYEEWKADPSTAQPWEEVEAELRADGLLDD